ncbi:MAG: hypothetical protein FJW37_10990 [Acidobacteria bacterium]|nr:hypothetical protein [Acidobacteriota bacterium]
MSRAAIAAAAIALCLAVWAAPPPPAGTEEEELSTALAESSSSLELIRALERHLEKFPAAQRKAEIERALLKAAHEAQDQRRTLLYGERVLAREPEDIQTLDKVIRALLAREDRESSTRLLKYARRYEALVTELRKQPTPGKVTAGEWITGLDRGLGWALAAQARASGNLGRAGEALALAGKS